MSTSEAVHVHDWKSPEGPCVVIDTIPPQYHYVCECGAFTHAPGTGVPCRICAPTDYDQRTTDLVRLEGGHLDGTWVPRPQNQRVNLRVDSADKAVQLFDIYKPTDDPQVWKFYANDWTHPVVRREPVP